MDGKLTFYQLSSEVANEVLERVEAFNRGRTRERGSYVISLATAYRPYYALWRIFPDSDIPLFIRTLAVTFDVAAERAMKLLQNCNVVLSVADNAVFERCYGLTDDVIPFCPLNRISETICVCSFRVDCTEASDIICQPVCRK